MHGENRRRVDEKEKKGSRQKNNAWKRADQSRTEVAQEMMNIRPPIFAGPRSAWSKNNIYNGELESGIKRKEKKSISETPDMPSDKC